jgi:catechol 2,3-dioxygenase-like lactoylglutathione lyase family enzyme
MQPRFNGIAFISDDVLGLSSFYAGLLQATVEGDGTFAFIRGPGTALSVFSRAGMEAMVPGSTDGAGSGNFTIEFEVDDVDVRHEELLGSGTRILKPPTTQPWGRRSLWLRDPDGNIVNLYQQAGSLSRTDHRAWPVTCRLTCLLLPVVTNRDDQTVAAPSPAPTRPRWGIISPGRYTSWSGCGALLRSREPLNSTVELVTRRQNGQIDGVIRSSMPALA